MRGLSPICHRRAAVELPTLDKLVVRRGPSATTSASIHALLRKIALENRNGDFQRFYSIRSVAAHFEVPPATVTRIYRRLSAERLLRLIWGSKTLLEPAEAARRKRPRSIGVPITLLRFTSSPNYRSAIFKLQRQIWNYGAIERFLFFEDRGEEVLHVCKRRGLGGVDTVIWLFPDICHRDALLRLHDIGIHVICIGYFPISGIHDYHTLSRTQSVGTIVRQELLTAGRNDATD